MTTQFKIFIDDKSKQIEFMEYDYFQKSYREVLNEAYQRGLRQIIFTTSIFKQLIHKIYDENCFLLEINFIESIDVHNFEGINELIRQINSANGGKNLVDLLLKEVDWFVNEESIDVKTIVFMDMESREKIEIYSNGVILGKRDLVETKLKDKFTPFFVRD